MTQRKNSGRTVHRNGNTNRAPSATKAGPGRYHQHGHTTKKPRTTAGAGPYFVLHAASNDKRNRRATIKAVGGIRQFKRMQYAERGLVYSAGPV